jgi:HlyD family secretion protein
MSDLESAQGKCRHPGDGDIDLVTRCHRLFLLSFGCFAACRANPRGVVEAIGTLEVTEIDATPLTPARVTKVWRQEGERVRPGDTLLTLTQSTLPSSIAAQQAALAAAEAQLRDLVAGPRPAQIAEAESRLRVAESDAGRAQRDLDRVAPLAASGTVSTQQLDAARNAAQAAAGQRDAARDALRFLREGARPDQVQAAREAVNSARAALRGAQQTATDLVLTSSIDGVVTGRFVEPGEILAPGQSGMSVADVTRPFVRIYVDEAVLPTIHLEDTLNVRLDAMPDHWFRGIVVALNNRAEFTPRVALTRDERADLMFGVKIQLVDPATTLKAGLPATVRLSPRAAP